MRPKKTSLEELAEFMTNVAIGWVVYMIIVITVFISTWNSGGDHGQRKAHAAYPEAPSASAPNIFKLNS